MSDDYSPHNVLERIYYNELTLEAAIMELTLWVEQRSSLAVGDNIRGALEAMGENCFWTVAGPS